MLRKLLRQVGSPSELPSDTPQRQTVPHAITADPPPYLAPPWQPWVPQRVALGDVASFAPPHDHLHALAPAAVADWPNGSSIRLPPPPPPPSIRMAGIASSPALLPAAGQLPHQTTSLGRSTLPFPASDEPTRSQIQPALNDNSVDPPLLAENGAGWTSLAIEVEDSDVAFDRSRKVERLADVVPREQPVTVAPAGESSPPSSRPRRTSKAKKSLRERLPSFSFGQRRVGDQAAKDRQAQDAATTKVDTATVQQPGNGADLAWIEAKRQAEDKFASWLTRSATLGATPEDEAKGASERPPIVSGDAGEQRMGKAAPNALAIGAAPVSASEQSIGHLTTGQTPKDSPQQSRPSQARVRPRKPVAGIDADDLATELSSLVSKHPRLRAKPNKAEGAAAASGDVATTGSAAPLLTPVQLHLPWVSGDQPPPTAHQCSVSAKPKQVGQTQVDGMTASGHQDALHQSSVFTAPSTLLTFGTLGPPTDDQQQQANGSDSSNKRGRQMPQSQPMLREEPTMASFLPLLELERKERPSTARRLSHAPRTRSSLGGDDENDDDDEWGIELGSSADASVVDRIEKWRNQVRSPAPSAVGVAESSISRRTESCNVDDSMSKLTSVSRSPLGPQLTVAVQGETGAEIRSIAPTDELKMPHRNDAGSGCESDDGSSQRTIECQESPLRTNMTPLRRFGQPLGRVQLLDRAEGGKSASSSQVIAPTTKGIEAGYRPVAQGAPKAGRIVARDKPSSQLVGAKTLGTRHHYRLSDSEAEAVFNPASNRASPPRVSGHRSSPSTEQQTTTSTPSPTALSSRSRQGIDTSSPDVKRASSSSAQTSDVQAMQREMLAKAVDRLTSYVENAGELTSLQKSLVALHEKLLATSPSSPGKRDDLDARVALLEKAVFASSLSP